MVDSLCRAAAWAAAATCHAQELASQDCQLQPPVRTDLLESACDGVLLHATLALACLSHDDGPTAAAVVSSAFAQHGATVVAATMMRGFSLVSPSSSSCSKLDRTGQAAAAPAAACFTTHSTQLIGLLALLMGHDPGITTGDVHQRRILRGDTALSALQLLAGAWPFLQGLARRWVALAVCAYLPLVLPHTQTSSPTRAESAAVAQHAFDAHPSVVPLAATAACPSSTLSPVPQPLLVSNSPSSSRARLTPRVAILSLSQPTAAPAAADVTMSPSHHAHSDVPGAPTNDHGALSALNSDRYARFHPLLTFALRLQVPSALSAALLHLTRTPARLQRTHSTPASCGTPCCVCPCPCRF